jgi:hypothetical protein
MYRRCAGWTIAGMMLAGCADKSPPPAPASPESLQPVFCYRTLADVDCYTELDPGRETRLTGIYMFVGDPWWVTYAAEEAGEAGATADPLPLFPVNP